MKKINMLTLMIVWKCCCYDTPIFFLFHLISVFCMREYVHSNTGISSLYLAVCRYIRYRYPCSKAMDNTGTRVFSEILYRCHELSLPLNRVCTGQSSDSERARDRWQSAAVTPQVNLCFSFVSWEFIVCIVISAIAVFRLVDNILSSSLHC